MNRVHELNRAAFQLGRVYQYLTKANAEDAAMLVIMAQSAVDSEYRLLEAVRIFTETH
jgi:hypothetical protein